MNLQDIAYAIKLAIDAKKYEDYPRPYLGMSQIGETCGRKLWMYFRWAFKTSHKHKSQRIFDRGNMEEARVLNYWRHIGIEILEAQTTLIACDGHFKGHTDGKITNVPGLEQEVMTGEIKTMQEKYFKPLAKKNDLRKSKPEYWAQAIVYMYHQGTDYCLHSTTNKNNEDIHIEIVEKNSEIGDELTKRANDIIFGISPPPKISEDPTYWKCGFCDFFNQCQLDENYMKSCRTCVYSAPVEDGLWSCSNTEHSERTILTINDQKNPCQHYDMLKV